MQASSVSKRSRAETINETPNANKPAQKKRAGANQAAQQQQRTKWTDEMEKLLLEHLVDAQCAGQGTDNGSFKATTYTEIIPKLREHTSMLLSEAQCSSKLDYFKRIWKTWEAHLAAISGWSWNEEKGVPETDPAVMDIYFDKHKDRRRFRHAPPPYKEMLEALFVGALATGDTAFSLEEVVAIDSSDSDSDEELPGESSQININ
jgi:Myb/SANT-like DNA-binding domain